MGTELVTIDKLNIAALSDNNAAELMEEALAGESLSLSDMERVKWPTSGNTKFTRTILGNEETTDKITGVIIHQGMSRAYWKNPDPIPGQNPDCKSPDGKFGFGDPGDRLRAVEPAPVGCKACPMAQFGSDPKEGSQAQACKLTRDFFILPQDGGMLPILLSIPPGSLGQAKGYVVGLAEHGIRYFHALTEITLERMQNKAGIAYAQARVRYVGRIEDDAVERISAYRLTLEDAFKTMVPAEGVIAEAAAGVEHDTGDFDPNDVNKTKSTQAK